MKNERKRFNFAAALLCCALCLISAFAGCAKNNVTDVDDVPDPQLAALKQSAIEQIDDNKIITIKQKYQWFVSDVVYRYDLERNMLYFSMYADTLVGYAQSGRKNNRLRRKRRLYRHVLLQGRRISRLRRLQDCKGRKRQSSDARTGRGSCLYLSQRNPDENNA